MPYIHCVMHGDRYSDSSFQLLRKWSILGTLLYFPGYFADDRNQHNVDGVFRFPLRSLIRRDSLEMLWL